MSTKASNLAQRVASGQWLTSTAGQSTQDHLSQGWEWLTDLMLASRETKPEQSPSSSESTSEESPPKK